MWLLLVDITVLNAVIREDLGHLLIVLRGVPFTFEVQLLQSYKVIE